MLYKFNALQKFILLLIFKVYNMKKCFLLILSCLFLMISIEAQQRMIVKPEGFDYTKLPKIPDVYVPPVPIKHVYHVDNVDVTVDSNLRIVPTSGNQTECSGTIWQVNANYIFCGTNSDPGQGYYYSTNGGLNWGGGDLLPGSVEISSDPACAYDNLGTIHFNYFDNTMVSDRSTNGGANWLGRVIIPSNNNFDKNHNTVDNITTSPYYGRIYVVWSNFAASSPPIVLSYSTDGGQSYSYQQQIGQPLSGHYEQGANIQTGPNGEVYCIWATPNSSTIEDHIGFVKSTNGGLNWTTPTYITVNGIRGNLLTSSIRVNSFPSMQVDKTGGARNGYIYITWAQRSLAPAGNYADICFCFSSNAGTNWSTPVRVNNDTLNNGKNQFFPWMAVDQSTGMIGIVFYDQRDNINNDSCNTYFAYSTDGGSTWPNIRVSNHSQRPAPLFGYASGYYGDYIGLCAYNHIFWPFLMDNRNGPAQVYTAKITIGTPVAVQNNNEGIPSSFKLLQNYPNPFNPSTTIKFELPLTKGAGGMYVNLVIYDILGNKIATLLNENKSAGSYSVKFDALNLASGIYFYKLSATGGAGNFSYVKKMVLIK